MQLTGALGFGENDGASFDRDARLLRAGDSALGDLVDRVEISVRPLAPFIHNELDRFVVHAGVGTVFRDDRASLLRDDDVSEWYAGLAYPGDEIQWGTRYLNRDETLADGDELRRHSLDSYFSFEAPVYLLDSEVRGDVQALWVKSESWHPGGMAEQQGVVVVAAAHIDGDALIWRQACVWDGFKVTTPRRLNERG